MGGKQRQWQDALQEGHIGPPPKPAPEPLPVQLNAQPIEWVVTYPAPNRPIGVIRRVKIHRTVWYRATSWHRIPDERCDFGHYRTAEDAARAIHARHTRPHPSQLATGPNTSRPAPPLPRGGEPFDDRGYPRLHD